MEITFRLSTKDIARAKQEIKAYRDGLVEKCRIFVERLADHGISVAQLYTGEYGNLITFSKEIEATRNGATGIMLATSGTITRQWMTQGRIKSADIIPLLMVEFGSGWKASDASGKPNAGTAKALGYGQGTFPGQTHAFDPGGWYWQDLDGEWHSSEGEEPEMPVFHASMAMEMELFDIAQEVFGS